MSDHEWCRDVRRDEAVRAAEDAAAVPSIQHRDLPEQVALVWASLGDLIGRVVRLEGEFDAGQDEEADAASDEAVAHGATLKALAEARESLAAANRGIARLTAERDAAREECERLRARVAELEFAYSAECDARAQAHRELSDLNDAIRARESGEERDSSYAALCREAAAARERADSMMPAKAAPAANAGGEDNSEPVAWGVLIDSGRGLYGHYDFEAEARGVCDAVNAEEGWSMTVIPLYAAPQPPRGWLTAEEREQVQRARDELLSGTDGYDNEFANEKRRRAGVLTALLARSKPPRVKVPAWLHADVRGVVADAIRAAGGEVEG